MGKEVQVFDARRPHAVRKVPGWFIVGYTPLGVHKILDEDKGLLSDLRFRLPSAPDDVVQARAVRIASKEEDATSPEDTP